MFFRGRILTIYIVFLLVFAALLGRLAFIQFVEGPGYARQAAAQRLRTVDFIQHPRGQILDCRLRPLTNNEKKPCVVIFPVMVKDFDLTASFLSEALAIPIKTVTSRLGKPKTHNNFTVIKDPFILKTNANEQEIDLIQKACLPGVFVLPLIPRYRPGYPAVHTLGYVGDQGSESTKETKTVGWNGVEKQFDGYLQGGIGQQVAVVIDDRGRHLSGRGFTLLSPGPGKEEKSSNVVLTLNRDFQEIVESEMDGRSGAAVVMDVKKGDILAMASSPGFNPDFPENLSADDAFINKALANYPPASVFKILIAAAALEEGLVSPEDTFHCPGFITIPTGRKVSCWNREGHGDLTFAQAMAFSCNPVLIEAGLKLGGETIKDYAKKMGLYDNNIIGYSTVKENHFEFNSSVPGDVGNVSIGENGVRLNPVQVAKLVSSVANGGWSVQPRLVLGVRDTKGNVIEEYQVPSSRQVLSRKTAGHLKMMLAGAVKEGTGQAAAVPGLAVGGKTGSSETHGVWFAGFAPVEEPLWAVVVFIEHGSSGAQAAAPVFRGIVQRLAELEGII